MDQLLVSSAADVPVPWSYGVNVLKYSQLVFVLLFLVYYAFVGVCKNLIDFLILRSSHFYIVATRKCSISHVPLRRFIIALQIFIVLRVSYLFLAHHQRNGTAFLIVGILVKELCIIFNLGNKDGILFVRGDCNRVSSFNYAFSNLVGRGNRCISLSVDILLVLVLQIEVIDNCIPAILLSREAACEVQVPKFSVRYSSSGTWSSHFSILMGCVV